MAVEELERGLLKGIIDKVHTRVGGTPKRRILVVAQSQVENQIAPEGNRILDEDGPNGGRPSVVQVLEIRLDIIVFLILLKVIAVFQPSDQGLVTPELFRNIELCSP